MRPFTTATRALRALCLTICLLMASAGAAFADSSTPDALDEALALAGLTRSDLGWEARGWWERYPADIPYKLRHFDDLLAEPLAVMPFTRGMGATLINTLAPDQVAGGTGPRGAGALYRAVHDLGVNKRFGATRAYSANLSAPPTPLDVALLECWRAGDRKSSFAVFGTAPTSIPEKARLTETCAALPPEISGILGKLVLDLLEARAMAELAFRRVDLETRTRVASRIDLGNEMTDAQEYEPAIDDLALAWDEASLWIAGLKAVEALDVARLALNDTLPDLRDRNRLQSFRLSVETPVGLVIIDGTRDATHEIGAEGAFLIVDLGGNDNYRGPIASSNAHRVLGAVLDLSGQDLYDAGDAALGAGVTGIGVLLDADGNDRYVSRTMGQGAGLFGLGVLCDLAGDDTYVHRFSGQGAGFFGIGLLLDLTGTDSYEIWGDGQGFGGVAGVGVLADREGNDTYVAVVDPKVTGRPSGHSENRISASGAQGCGMGRRGDGSDGHSWAGGLGVLLDASGDDKFTVGNWGQGCGYWFGTGIFWDGAGNDEVRGTGWTSASGAHFCIGVRIDESGDDLHSTSQNWGPAFGHDFTVAVLYDGGGNDRYECGSEGVGHSINRSVALCFDVGGDDEYLFATEGKRPGLVTYDPRFLDRTTPSVYWTESTSIGLFIDIGGKDVYRRWAEGPGATIVDPSPLPEIGNDVSKTDDPASDTYRARNFGVFVDRAAGTLDLQRPHGGLR